MARYTGRQSRLERLKAAVEDQRARSIERARFNIRIQSIFDALPAPERKSLSERFWKTRRAVHGEYCLADWLATEFPTWAVDATSDEKPSAAS